MKSTVSLILIIVFALHAGVFLSQETIDSTVQNAFYGFVEASRSTGVVGSQRSAIERAQNAASELRRIAEKDPNRRYIMWRVSELEQQIFLEQEELNLKDEYQRVTEINRLVSIFNAELFLARPDFAKLHALLNQVEVISVKHGNQFVENINQKNRVVVNNLQADVEDAFERGDYQAVEKSYMYAVRNRKYLNLKYYDQWSDRIQAKKNADFLRDNLDQELMALNALVQKNKISEARRTVEIVRADLESASKYLSTTMAQTASGKLSRFARSVDVREDSLVQVGMNLAIARKSEQASYYMDRVLRPAGVNPDKIASIDREILNRTVVEKKQNREVDAEIDNISANTSKSDLSTSQLNSQLRMSGDSLRRHYEEMDTKVRNRYVETHQAEFDQIQKAGVLQEAERTKADALLARIKSLLDRGKAGDADKLMLKNETNLLLYSAPNLYIEVSRSLNRSLGKDDSDDSRIQTVLLRKKEESPEMQEEKCVEITTQVYTALEKRDVMGAAGLFYRNEMLLRNHSYVEAYQTMKKQIVKEYSRKYMK